MTNRPAETDYRIIDRTKLNEIHPMETFFWLSREPKNPTGKQPATLYVPFAETEADMVISTLLPDQDDLSYPDIVNPTCTIEVTDAGARLAIPDYHTALERRGLARFLGQDTLGLVAQARIRKANSNDLNRRIWPDANRSESLGVTLSQQQRKYIVKNIATLSLSQSLEGLHRQFFGDIDPDEE